MPIRFLSWRRQSKMKKFFKVIALALAGMQTALAQQNDVQLYSSNPELEASPSFTKKGQMFIFWGWNRAAFTRSDIHFRGNGYNFTLENVVAHDRPSPLDWAYVDPGQLTTPQFNFRAGYFIKDDVAIVFGTDHMKYVMDQEQTVNLRGTVSDPTYAAMVVDGKVDLSDSSFLTFEHTDGLNYVNVGLEKYKPLLSRKKMHLMWSYGGGAGVLFPKSNVKLFDNERSDRFHVAGFGLDAHTNINAVFFKHWMARVEAKTGYINMPDIKTTLNNRPDKASQQFMFGQINFGIGYLFNT